MTIPTPQVPTPPAAAKPSAVSWRKASFWRRALLGILPLLMVFVVVYGEKHGWRSWATEKMFWMLFLSSMGVLTLLTRAAHWGKPGSEDTVPVGVASAKSPVTNPHEKWFELLKLEYDNGAARYENIYKAIWQNFSYSAVLAAAILTFAATKFRMDLLQSVALAPIVFWFVATFIPMDKYGDQTRTRLKQIERNINQVFFGDDFAKGRELGFGHFTSFASERLLWRVGDVVRLVGVFICVYWIWLVASVLTANDKGPLILPPPPTVTAVPAPLDVGSRSSREVDSLRRMVSRQQEQLDAILRSRRSSRVPNDSH